MCMHHKFICSAKTLLKSGSQDVTFPKSFGSMYVTYPSGKEPVESIGKWQTKLGR